MSVLTYWQHKEVGVWWRTLYIVTICICGVCGSDTYVLYHAVLCLYDFILSWVHSLIHCPFGHPFSQTLTCRESGDSEGVGAASVILVFRLYYGSFKYFAFDMNHLAPHLLS